MRIWKLARRGLGNGAYNSSVCYSLCVELGGRWGSHRSLYSTAFDLFGASNLRVSEDDSWHSLS